MKNVPLTRDNNPDETSRQYKIRRVNAAGYYGAPSMRENKRYRNCRKRRRERLPAEYLAKSEPEHGGLLVPVGYVLIDFELRRR